MSFPASRVYKCTPISVLFWAVGFETALRSNFQPSKQICDCNYTHQLANDLTIKTIGNCQPNVAEKLTLCD